MFAGAVGYLVALLMTGCAYCKLPEHASEGRCKALAGIERCGKEALSLLPALLPFVIAEDWSGLINELERSTAPQEGACILSAIEGLFTSKGKAIPDALRDGSRLYRARHGISK